MAQRVSNDTSLTLGEGSPNARVTSDASLALGEGSPAARVSQVACLVLISAAINRIQPVVLILS